MRKPLVLIILIIALTAGLAYAWTEPVQISNQGLLSARADASGDTLLVAGNIPWIDFYIVRSFDNGLSWGQPFNPADTFYSDFLPDIIYSKGLFHIVWTSALFNIPDQAYHISSSDAGMTWSRPHPIVRNPLDGLVNYPRLAANGDTLFLSCLKYNTLLYRSFDRGVTWGDSITVDTQASQINYPPTILFSQSRLHLFYEANYYYDSVGMEIYYCHSDDYGLTWNQRIIISTAEPIPNYVHSQFPSAYVDSSGNIVVAWFDYKYGSYCGYSGDILSRISSDNGDTWGPECRITMTQSGEASSCIIVDDTVQIAWMDDYPYGCGNPKIMHSQSSNWGASWTEPEIISGTVVRFEASPMLFSSTVRGGSYVHCVFDSDIPGSNRNIYYLRNKDFATGINANLPAILAPMNVRAHPNSFNSSTMITIDNWDGGSGILEIFNILGQRVWSQKIVGKEANIIWDAKDKDGNGVSSGAYFVRATTENSVAKIKILYLK